ncbi:6-phosphogluconolactonase [Arcobacter sp.]|uniref:6-phosphogluconolactonase n=1 Tax=Arcobacter sp. TaxID=1872629 RepID=UPI003D13A03A
MSANFFHFSSQDSLIEFFSKEICKRLEIAICKKGEASLLVSGGNTPKALFVKLSQIDLDWEKVKIGLVDERWINEDSKDSNSYLVREFLLKDKAAKATFIPLYKKEINAADAEELCSSLVKEKLYPCDVLILGMGNDAHTASLFPNNDKLIDALNLENQNYCISMNPQTAPYSRMSLTLSAILEAEKIYLHIEGKNKKEVYDKALIENDYYISPISAVLKNNRKQIEVYYNE